MNRALSTVAALKPHGGEASLRSARFNAFVILAESFGLPLLAGQSNAINSHRDGSDRYLGRDQHSADHPGRRRHPRRHRAGRSEQIGSIVAAVSLIGGFALRFTWVPCATGISVGRGQPVALACRP